MLRYSVTSNYDNWNIITIYYQRKETKENVRRITEKFIEFHSKMLFNIIRLRELTLLK